MNHELLLVIIAVGLLVGSSYSFFSNSRFFIHHHHYHHHKNVVQYWNNLFLESSLSTSPNEPSSSSSSSSSSESIPSESLSSSSSTESSSSSSSLSSSLSSSSCPFSKRYPRYRIDLTRSSRSSSSSSSSSSSNNNNDKNKSRGGGGGGGVLSSLSFVSGFQKSWMKQRLENKYKDIPIYQWLGDEGTTSLEVFATLWRTASDVVVASTQKEKEKEKEKEEEEENEKECEENRSPVPAAVVVVGSEHFGLVQNWIHIMNWMQEEQQGLLLYDEPMIIKGTIVSNDEIYPERGVVVSVELYRHPSHQTQKQQQHQQKQQQHQQKQQQQQQFQSMQHPSSSVIERRTQAWVKRILVDQGICPFTKSVKASGQGLTDLGIYAAPIYYTTSMATKKQITMLMADTWEAIQHMIVAGPSGKTGISSILLAAPDYDTNFDLWAGPIFTMLEAGVISAGVESQVGVVCFHPNYMTPDGSSWPGFGHMHSVPRLQKWFNEQRQLQQKQQQQPQQQSQSQQQSQQPYEPLTLEELAAGGAWQRRTPHATINVLRADQLEVAEGRRNTPSLYSENIQKLVGKPNGIGSKQLFDDLERERNLL